MVVNPYDSNNPVSPQDFAGREDLKSREESKDLEMFMISWR